MDALLADVEKSEQFFVVPAGALATSRGEGLEGSLTGMRIGAYTLGPPLATGGMGTVYEARQDDPGRRVALKLSRLGLASPVVLRRFQVEAEILARLRHPGIAQVYEAGTYREPASGVELPWFAMEYIEGARSLTLHAKEEELSLRERLELFLVVCDAVQHGHQRGVIHRGLEAGEHPRRRVRDGRASSTSVWPAPRDVTQTQRPCTRARASWSERWPT